MIPSVSEMINELNSLQGLLIYRSAQHGEWGVIKDNEYLFKFSELNPSDQFLLFYIHQFRELSLVH